jgi:hypothetical protein
VGRGRPRKMNLGVKKSFFLPADLVEQLSLAADLLEVDVADVVRAILAENIDGCVKQAIKKRNTRLKQCIAAVEGNQTLAPIFRDNKGMGVVTQPASLPPTDAKAIMEALAAYTELEDVAAITERVKELGP